MADQSALVAKLRTLTPRQLEVLSLLNKGFLHKEIAQQLHITEQGVVYHVTRIYQKLGIKDLPSGPRRIELGKYCSVLPYLSLNQLPQPDSERGEASGVMHEDNDELADQDTPPNSGGSDEPSQEALAIIQVLQAVIEDEAVLAVREEPGVLARRPVTYGSWWRAGPRRPKFQTRVLPFVLVALVSLLVGSGGTLLAIQWPLNNQTIAGGPTTTGTFDSSPLQATGAATSLAPSPSSAPTTIVEAAGVCGSAQPRIPEAPAARFVRDQGVSLFTPDNTNNGVLTQRVRALALDERGVWIGYFATDQLPSGGLGQYNKQEWTNCNNAAAVAGVNVNALAFDQRGQLWVATEKHGIAMFDGELWHTYTVTNTKQLRNNETFGITVDQQNNVWFATWEGIAKFDGKEWSMPYTAYNSTLSSGRVHTVAFDSANGMWVGHIGGPDRLGGVSHRTADNQWHYYTKGKELSGNNVSSILVEPAASTQPETIWIATFDGGISSFRQGSWTQYNEGDGSGLPSNRVQTLARDPLGRIWAGTDKGASYFDGSRWTRYHTFSTESIAFGPACQSCPYDRDHVWTGTIAGLTHSRLPPAEQRFDIDQVCFERVEGQPNQPICPALSQSTETITVTNPIALTSGDRFRVAVVVRPRAPYQLRIGDFLSNTDRDDFHLFGAHINMPVTEVVEPGAPYTLISPDNPFQAPLLDTSKIEQTFVSNWRLWMHGRYAGPTIRIQFTVHNQKQPGG